MKKLTKRMMTLLLTCIILLSIVPVTSQAAAVRTTCYTISSGNTEVYAGSSLRRTGSKAYGYIYGTDEVQLLELTDSYAKVKYPVKNGTKTGYIKRSAVVLSKNGTARYATKKITTYRRNNTSKTYGSIYKNDRVLLLGYSGSWAQVMYPVSGGQKVAWISKSEAANGLASSKTTSGTSNSNTNSTKISLAVPKYMQYDSRWKNVYIGTKTIGQIGCTTTCLAMKYSFHTGTSTTPDKMKKKLSYSNNDLLYASVSRLGYTYTGAYNSKINQSIMKTIYNQLKNRKPVILGGRQYSTSGAQHWIVIIGYTGSSSSSFKASDFTIIDPNSSSRTTLSAFLNYRPYVYRLIY